MEFSSNLVKVHLANYLANLPFPNSFTGIFKLGGKYYFKHIKNGITSSKNYTGLNEHANFYFLSPKNN